MKKRNIVACAGCLLVLLLGITMVCGGCKKDDTPDWNYSGTTQGTTQNTEGTKAPTPAGPDDPAPSVDISIVDREDLEGTTAPTTDQQEGTTAPSTGVEERPTIPNIPTNPTTPNNPTTPVIPTTPAPGPAEPELDTDGRWTYEYYISRTGEEQMAYYDTFPSMKEFNKWYNAAKAAYDAAHPKETIVDGNITLD